MGYHSRATIHGFRSTASTILNESEQWRPDAIERQLAHVPENEVRSAYHAALYLEERTRMMKWYSEAHIHWNGWGLRLPIRQHFFTRPSSGLYRRPPRVYILLGKFPNYLLNGLQ